ncbi:hypothetical protein H0G86_004273 [Trichoderma simmonsii]|uniref:Uncharacterized protein n=1 Tax=Trichoderma simmonsii TaxID=1491479 RepID=A0A8G0PHS2_9HYPO|nr:hypothetical protein H0G86_004273 [Trichoderma simmonsii]
MSLFSETGYEPASTGTICLQTPLELLGLHLDRVFWDLRATCRIRQWHLELLFPRLSCSKYLAHEYLPAYQAGRYVSTVSSGITPHGPLSSCVGFAVPDTQASVIQAL